jgi:hypothetical protein
MSINDYIKNMTINNVENLLKYEQMGWVEFVSQYDSRKFKNFFNYNDSRLSSNKSFMMLMVQMNGLYLRYASRYLIKDRELILHAALQCKFRIEDISEMYHIYPYTRSEIERYIPGYYD